MKILSQDKTFIAELGRECWVTGNGTDNFTIVHTGYSHPYLGHYRTEERALNILESIFNHYKNGDEAFEMPIE